MIDTTTARQTVMTLCDAVSFKTIKQSQKYRQKRFRKIAETTIYTESKQSQTKKLNILQFTPST